MASTNTIVIIGYLGQDPELRETPEGTPVCNLSVSTKYGYGEKEHTDWHKVTVWDKQAKACGENLTKGSRVGVTGRLTYETWEAKDGGKRTSAKIIAHNVEFLGSPEGGSQKKQGNEQRKAQTPPRQNTGGFGGQSKPAGPAGSDDGWPF